MRLRAVVIILRKDGLFHLDQSIIHRRFNGGWKGFSKSKVKAVYPRCGYGVALILKHSQVDEDFGVPTLFLTQEQLEAIMEAMKRSDDLTAELLNKRSWGGKRPFVSTKLHLYM